MMNIWNSIAMEMTVERASRQGVIEFAEIVLGESLVQNGPAGKSRFNKALEILAARDFEVYSNLTNELLNGGN